jgi:hypothetical protein
MSTRPRFGTSVSEPLLSMWKHHQNLPFLDRLERIHTYAEEWDSQGRAVGCICIRRTTLSPLNPLHVSEVIVPRGFWPLFGVFPASVRTPIGTELHGNASTMIRLRLPTSRAGQSWKRADANEWR